jgi:hypothetical protein
MHQLGESTEIANSVTSLPASLLHTCGNESRACSGSACVNGSEAYALEYQKRFHKKHSASRTDKVMDLIDFVSVSKGGVCIWSRL